MATPPKVLAPAISPQPLVCIPGEQRPEQVPFLIYNERDFFEYMEPEEKRKELKVAGFVEAKNCSVETAKKFYHRVIDGYKNACNPENTCLSHHYKIAGCQMLQDYCRKAQGFIPNYLFTMGSEKAAHPFMDIVYYSDQYVIDDFRSANVFAQAAENPELQRAAEQRGHLNFLYSGSGSHMPLWLIPLILIDQGKLQSATIIYTEVKIENLERIKIYLDFQKARGMIDFAEPKKLTMLQGEETFYQIKYKDHDITFVFALNTGGELWSPERFIDKSDFILFHDGVFNDNEKDNKFPRADLYFERLNKLAQADPQRKRFILSENQWHCNPANTECSVAGRLFPVQYYREFYGCMGDTTHGVPWYQAVSHLDGSLALQRFATSEPKQKDCFSEILSEQQACKEENKLRAAIVAEPDVLRNKFIHTDLPSPERDYKDSLPGGAFLFTIGAEVKP